MLRRGNIPRYNRTLGATNTMMRTDELDFELPPELIAQTPAIDRAASRLLHYQRSTQTITHRIFSDLTQLLRPGDLLTFGRRGRSGVSHIGIYVGQGRYVHASSVAGRVIESDLNRTGSPLIKAWRGVRRIVAGAEPDTGLARIGG